MKFFLKNIHERQINKLAVTATVAVLLATLALIIYLFERVPPRTLTITTASEDGAYYRYAKRYQEILAQNGITLNILTSKGVMENIERLREADSGVSAAFVQGGIVSSRKAPELASLGAMFYEPVWVFYRGQSLARAESWNKGTRVSAGRTGSGTRKLSLDLLKAVGVKLEEVQILDLSPQAAADALTKGEIDIMTYVASWESPIPRRLLTTKGINVHTFDRADAHVALRPFLSKLVLPEGAADLAMNRPSRNVVLLAPKASLVVRKDMHPALQYALLDAAYQVHAIPSIFHVYEDFPSDDVVDLPLSVPAANYYKSGSPFLQRYMPFWVAVLVMQILLVLLPIIGIAYPLLRVLPAVYGWGMRRRIFNLYGELKFLESALEARTHDEPVYDLLGELNRLEKRANHMKIPDAYSQPLYILRQHIGMVRTRLEQRQFAEEDKKTESSPN
jgi:TRAP transporter TAXI family solute receptor